MANPYLNNGLWPKVHYDCELTASTFNLPSAHRFGPKGSASQVSVYNRDLPVIDLFPIILVHSNGNVYVFITSATNQVTLYKMTKDLAISGQSVHNGIPHAGYALIASDGYIYLAGGDALYKFDPVSLTYASTNKTFQYLNFLNILYDGRLVAANNAGNLFVFERDFDTVPAHKDPIAQYTNINEINDNTIAVDSTNKIYVITRTNVWAVKWDSTANPPFSCRWKYGYATSGSGSGSSVTVAGNKVIFADKPSLAPFRYVSIPKDQDTSCGTPLNICLQTAAASGAVDPRNSFNYGSDIAIVLGTGSLNGQIRRFTVSSCAPAVWIHNVDNAWPTPLLTPDRVYVYYREGTNRKMKSIFLSGSQQGTEEWNKLISSGSDFSSFDTIVKGEDTRVYVGTGAGVSMLKNI